MCECLYRFFYNLICTEIAFCCQQPGGVFVHPSGAEKSLVDTIGELRKHHGDKQGKKFRVWVDQVLATETAPGTWMVKLDKWEQSGKSLIT